MRLAKMLTAVSVVSLIATPVMASTSASKLSLSQARVATKAAKSNKAVGGFLIPLIAVIAVIGGVVVAVDDNDEPDSP